MVKAATARERSRQQNNVTEEMRGRILEGKGTQRTRKKNTDSSRKQVHERTQKSHLHQVELDHKGVRFRFAPEGDHDGHRQNLNVSVVDPPSNALVRPFDSFLLH